MSSICIFTGEIKSGKTTRLQKFISENPDADGILAPVINGNRHLARIKTGETKLLEHLSEEPNPGLTTICNYKFLNSVFKWGMDELYNAYLQKPKWLIIDEIGPLELKGQALEPMVSRILNDEKRNEINIILVIRKTLVEKAIEHYKLHVKGFKFFTI